MSRTPAAASQRTLRTRIGSPWTGRSGLGMPSPTAAMRVLIPAARSIASTGIGQCPNLVDHMLANVSNRSHQPCGDVDFGRPSERSSQCEIGKRLFRVTRQVRFVARCEVSAQLRRDTVEDLANGIADARPHVVRLSVGPLVGHTQHMEVVDIIDVDEIAALRTRAIDDRTLAAQQLDYESAHDARDRAPVILARAVNAEVP